MNFVASTLMNGAPASLASRREISVLPTPVGPIIRMFFGSTSSRSVPVELLAPPAIAQGDGDGALGVVLADDVAVEFGDDFARREVHHVARSYVGSLAEQAVT